jgi:hypothetical protein
LIDWETSYLNVDPNSSEMLPEESLLNLEQIRFMERYFQLPEEC